MKQIVNVVFHDDVDGVFSAALFLHNHVRGESYRLYPIMSSHRGDKFSEVVSGMKLKDSDLLVVLDYEYHPRANLWVDHHWDRRMGNEPVHNEKIHYDPNAASTAGLVHQIPSTDRPEYSDAFLPLVDMIDQAGYRNVHQIFNDTHPMMIVRAYLEKTFPAEMMYCRLVEMFVRTHFDIKEANFRLKLNASCVHNLRQDVHRAKRDMTIFGGVSVIRQRRPNQFPRYAEFLIRPQTRYAVRMSFIGHDTLYFQISYNKWTDGENNVNIGTMLNQLKYLLKGGGHYNVGGGLLKVNDSEKFLDNLDVNLNKAEPMTEEPEGGMEKYGVDKEADPVEAKAEEMVKTGEAKTIQEARETVLSESKNADSEDKDSVSETTQ